jgi:hypothetical protein
MTVTVTIVPSDDQAKGKLADAELHFHGGPLDGMKLVGFGVYEPTRGKKRNVTFPAKPYRAGGGERRTFSLLRPIAGDTSEAVREFVLAAYAAWEASQ